MSASLVAASVRKVRPPLSRYATLSTNQPDNGSPSPAETPAEPRARKDPADRSVLLFPGQGSQFVGMGRGLLRYPNVREMFETARKILGYDLLSLCLNGPEEELVKTVHCQPAVFVTSMAAVEKLNHQNPKAIETCVAAAGFSVGEFAALVFSGAMSFAEGARRGHAAGVGAGARRDAVGGGGRSGSVQTRLPAGQRALPGVGRGRARLLRGHVPLSRRQGDRGAPPGAGLPAAERPALPLPQVQNAARRRGLPHRAHERRRRAPRRGSAAAGGASPRDQRVLQRGRQALHERGPRAAPADAPADGARQVGADAARDVRAGARRALPARLRGGAGPAAGRHAAAVQPKGLRRLRARPPRR
ncbi:malonyl-CoA-acyl carrier protein transacylase, mitochondrial isoform X2 [Syngnathoides biaculeatus]|uniref:malonyl-CoA-acyl carrier protein transacylase, mitochondrial isoform X2 n=1 Tax=Syngnathoides biaculeatus TaxID=300417 RepID=UPI002ADD7A9C|nr:malonyl-CoA-acyl carrier protein transacylase, mitochondrial isoform X2 [Syngnathoides biaculeatus]